MIDTNKDLNLDLTNIHVTMTTQQIIDLPKTNKKNEENEENEENKENKEKTPAQIYKLKYLKAKKLYYNIK